MTPTLYIAETSPAQTFVEPLSLPEVKSFLEVDYDDKDGDITAYISAARDVAEGLQNRDLIIKQWDLVFDYWPCSPIQLRAPLVSVDLVRSRDSAGAYTTLTVDTDYVVDTVAQPALIMPPYGQSWPSYTPWPSSSLTVRFTSGYSSTASFWAHSGERIKLGMKQLISHWFTEKLPFEMTNVQVQEYPYTVNALLSAGALPRYYAP